MYEHYGTRLFKISIDYTYDNYPANMSFYLHASDCRIAVKKARDSNMDKDIKYITATEGKGATALPWIVDANLKYIYDI